MRLVGATRPLPSAVREPERGRPSLPPSSSRSQAERTTSSKGRLAELASYLSFGASPRASIHLVEAGRALALLRGRDYVLPEDLTDLAPDVLRHRLVLSYPALAEGVTADELIAQIMKLIPAPERPLRTQVR
jgi:MoxR-like ATPase